jgi:hypothetical protein
MRVTRFSLQRVGGGGGGSSGDGAAGAEYLRMFKSVLDSASFYFCLTADVTRPLQRARGFGVPGGAPVMSAASVDFTWNRHLAEGFVQAGFETFAVPLMLSDDGGAVHRLHRFLIVDFAIAFV